MTINIKLDSEGYSLQSDSRQYIIFYQDRGISFHTTIEQAILSYFERKIRSCNAESISELIKYQKVVLAGLCKALQPLKIRVEVLKWESILFIIMKH